jgi:hypothetical protein
MRLNSQERIVLCYGIEVAILHANADMRMIAQSIKGETKKDQRAFLRAIKKITKEEIEIMKQIKARIWSKK